MVRLHEPLRIGLARGEIGRDRVHVVASVARHLSAVDGLRIAAARFGKLPCHAAHSNDGNACAPCEHEGHLQKNFQLRFDGGFGAVGKALGAIAALEQKGFAARGLGEVGAQGIHFAVVHQRRQCAHFVQRGLQRVGIGPQRLLLNGPCTPRVGRPIGWTVTHGRRLYRERGCGARLFARRRLSRALHGGHIQFGILHEYPAVMRQPWPRQG